MRAAFLTLVLAPVFAFAQSWCPPGATWTYGFDAFGSYGFEQYTYVGDTVLGGLSGQRIDLFGGMSSYLNDEQEFNMFPASLITALQDDVVMQWSDTYQGWDTVFWMGAEPGHVFHRPFANTNECDPLDRFEVTDTTTMTVQGLPLRRWTVESYWEGTFYGAFHFTERIGWEWSMLPYPGCFAIDGPAGMRCYSDAEIAVTFFEYGCTTLVGMDDLEREGTLAPYPNPGSDRLSFSLPPGVHTITLVDASGRTVLEMRTTSERPSLTTEGLTAGLYQVNVRGEDGTSVNSIWIKE